MKYLVEAGDCKVEVEISSESTDLMKAVEESAARLLAAALAGRPDTPKPAFGFALASDTELATPHPDPGDDGDTD